MFSETKSEIEIQYIENVIDTGIKGCHKNKPYKKYLNIPSAANEVNHKRYLNKSHPAESRKTAI